MQFDFRIIENYFGNNDNENGFFGSEKTKNKQMGKKNFYSEDFLDYGVSFKHKKTINNIENLKQDFEEIEKNNKNKIFIPSDVLRLNTINTKKSFFSNLKNKNNSSNNKTDSNKNNNFFNKKQYDGINLIEKKLNKFKNFKKIYTTNSEIIKIRKTRKKIIFIEHALQKILINYIKINCFLINRKQIKKISSIIYYFCSNDFFELDIIVHIINLKTVFLESWNYFYPYGLRLNKDQIVELGQIFDFWILENKYNNNDNYSNNNSNNDTNNSNNNNITIAFNRFCKWWYT
jgi:hypothetical protein